MPEVEIGDVAIRVHAGVTSMKGALFMATPTIKHDDGYGIGQVTRQWGKPEFVRQLINNGQLTVNAQGVITNAELARFHRESNTLLG